MTPPTRRRLFRWLTALAAVLILPPCLLGLLFASSSLPPLPVSPQEPLVLRGVTLVNPTDSGAVRRSGVTVRIEGGKIVSITDEGPGPGSGKGAGLDTESGTPGSPAGAGTVFGNSVTWAAPGAGGYVLPGLIDAHVHSPLLPGEQPLWATLYLLHGVTGVRNMGDGNQSLRHKREVAAGREAGPVLFSCGMLLDGPGGGFPARILRTPAEARAAVREEQAAGADCIKVLPHLTLDTFVALREEARAAGLPLVGHMVNVYGDRGIEESGIADVQHLTGLPEAPSPGMDDGEWRAFHLGFDRLTPERLASVVAASYRLGIVHTPTLVSGAYEAGGVGLSPRVDLLPPYYAPLWGALERARPEADRALARRNLPRYLDAVRALHRGSASVQAGSDVFPLIPWVVPGPGSTTSCACSPPPASAPRGRSSPPPWSRARRSGDGASSGWERPPTSSFFEKTRPHHWLIWTQ